MKAGTSGLGPSLIELVVAVLLFSLASAVCVKIFASAKLISDDGAALSMAITTAQSAAECFKASGGDTDETAGLIGGVRKESGFEAFYDNDWNTVESGEARYVLLGEITQEDGLSICKITVTTDGGDGIYDITVASHGEAVS